MLVEFRVKNFRSIRDEQVFSLVASKDKTFKETHSVPTGLPAVPTLLKSAVIYGANASGKSNLIRALDYMRGVVLTSGQVAPGRKFNVQPFLLDSASAQQATEFEVTFLIDRVRYQYGFSITKDCIFEEYLLVYKTSKPQSWFARSLDPETGGEHYKFGAGLEGTEKQKKFWRSVTPPNALFLSFASFFNSAPLKKVFDWFESKLFVARDMTEVNPGLSHDLLGDESGKRKLMKFLSTADISVADMSVEVRKVAGKSLQINMETGHTDVQEEENEAHQVRFHYKTEQGDAVFDLEDESEGTRKLFFLAGPLLSFLKEGATFVFDELDTSLHTLLVKEIVRSFYNPVVNCAQAQLIFTTHNVSLLKKGSGLFRRDQVWIVEKNSDQATELQALSDFRPRKNEDGERGFLAGRYGGIPFLEQGEGLSY